MFIASMTTYRPLLLRIKQAYDTALEDAAGSAYDHVHLQTELSLMPQRHVGHICWRGRILGIHHLHGLAQGWCRSAQ
jgi:hypothetical protein